MIQVRWHGRGGQGSFTIARLLGAAAVLQEGKNALAFPTFGPERRGAPVLGFTKISDEKIHDRSEVQTCDYVVVLDESLIDKNTAKGLADEGCMLINTQDVTPYEDMFDCKVIGLDATDIALKHIGRPITNTAMLGALIAESGMLQIESVKETIATEMRANLVVKNHGALMEAYDMIKGGKA
jgi:pyruvate ferredoxin oxidoreductase gamma subunit